MGPIFSNSTAFTNWFGGLGNAISDFNNSCLNLPESGSPSLADTANVISCANAVINAAGGFAEVFNISSLSTATNYAGLISNQANVSANIAQTLDAINNY